MLFSDRLENANPDSICGASVDSVGVCTMRDLLAWPLRIPIFQRRFVWNQKNWTRMLLDATAASRLRNHSLGRLTCAMVDDTGGVKTDNKKKRMLYVIDGQQRTTSAVLLLAAIRDVAIELSNTAAQNAADHESSKELERRVNEVILPDMKATQKWIGERRNGEVVRLEEGEALRFAALIPTYCDRASYFAAILPPTANTSYTLAQPESAWMRPLQAKQFFAKAVRKHTISQLRVLCDAILSKFTWLFFPIRVEGENLNVVFERLAQRDATWCRPHRNDEFVSLGPADFIRNLMLGSFLSEENAVAMYKCHWLPIEEAAAIAAATTRAPAEALLEQMFHAFVDSEERRLQMGRNESAARGPDPAASLGTFQSTLAPQALAKHYVGGQLYARFRAWVTAWASSGPKVEGVGSNRDTEATSIALATPLLPSLQVTNQGDQTMTMQEQHIVRPLIHLKTFALEYFSSRTPGDRVPSGGERKARTQDMVPPPPEYTSEVILRRAGQPGTPNPWVCPRCKTQNSVSAAICTACCYAL